MKKSVLITLTAISICMIAACTGHKDSTGTADSTNAANADSNKVASKDTSRGAVAVSTVSADDAKFAVAAANGSMAEVELGVLAQQKSTNPKVKEFGNMMATDHTKAGNDLLAITKSKSIVLPATINNKEQSIKDDLSKKSGADFDKAYVSDMIDDHKEDIKDFEAAAQNCKDPDLKAFAAKTLPTLKMHLDVIQKIHDGMK